MRIGAFYSPSSESSSTEPAWNGYLLTVACPRGVVFEWWVTLEDAEFVLLGLPRMN